ncbi:MAG: phosphatidylglycerol lysyltransferase domain-containing protein, partial [Actinomycetota bacterium]
PTALGAVVGRMVGSNAVRLPDRLADFLDPVMVSVSLGLLALVLWTVFRPAHAARRQQGTGLARAREIVAAHGGDSLAFFTLRQDKQLFFSGDTAVAYSVAGRVCLVSPDPVGPAWERDQAWEAFHRFADGQGWPVAVLGASEEWLPIYARTGMRDAYVGDEAIIDCSRFHLDQAQWHDLRQEVALVQSLGYRVEFFDPVRLDPFMESELRGLATESRNPGAEPHFSMTLGRLFDPEDRGLVLAVAFGPDGHPAAFCQFVPAPDGYTLDQFRRTTRRLPRALPDLLAVESIAHFALGGVRTVSMNFSVMGRTLASSARFGGRGQRWLLDHLAHATAPSPWSADPRYEPAWRSRFFVYDGRGHFPAAALAISRSESLTPAPTVGGAVAANGAVAVLAIGASDPSPNGLGEVGMPVAEPTREGPTGSIPPEAG